MEVQLLTPGALIMEIQRAGACIRVDGDLLRVRNDGALSDTLRAQIRTLKPQLLEWLKNGPPLGRPREIGEAILFAYATPEGYSFRHLRAPWKAANDVVGHDLTASQLAILARQWAAGNESLDVPELPVSDAQTYEEAG